MVTQITKGIKISVLTSFEGTYFKNYKIHFAFSYQITIENHSKDSVQLMTRHWEIFDSLQETEIVDGEGIIGKKPWVLKRIIQKRKHQNYQLNRITQLATISNLDSDIITLDVYVISIQYTYW